MQTAFEVCLRLLVSKWLWLLVIGRCLYGHGGPHDARWVHVHRTIKVPPGELRALHLVLDFRLDTLVGSKGRGIAVIAALQVSGSAKELVRAKALAMLESTLPQVSTSQDVQTLARRYMALNQEITTR